MDKWYLWMVGSACLFVWFIREVVTGRYIVAIMDFVLAAMWFSNAMAYKRK